MRINYMHPHICVSVPLIACMHVPLVIHMGSQLRKIKYACTTCHIHGPPIAENNNPTCIERIELVPSVVHMSMQISGLFNI